MPTLTALSYQDTFLFQYLILLPWLHSICLNLWQTLVKHDEETKPNFSEPEWPMTIDAADINFAEFREWENRDLIETENSLMISRTGQFVWKERHVDLFWERLRVKTSWKRSVTCRTGPGGPGLNISGQGLSLMIGWTCPTCHPRWTWGRRCQ